MLRVYYRRSRDRRRDERVRGQARDPSCEISTTFDVDRNGRRGKELSNREPQDIRDLVESPHRRVGYAPFDFADVARREFGPARKFAQAQLLPPPRRADPLPGVLALGVEGRLDMSVTVG